MITMGHYMTASTPKYNTNISKYFTGDRFKYFMPDRFQNVTVDYMMDTEFLEDFEEVVGRELDVNDGELEHNDAMVMELIWAFNHHIRVTDKTYEDYFQESVNQRKAYGIVTVIELYIPQGRDPYLWKYYYRKILQRDINNRLWFL